MTLDMIDPDWALPGRSDEVRRASVDAATVMAVLQSLVPEAAYTLAAWDLASGTRDHLMLAESGYSRDLISVMRANYRDENPWFRLLHHRPNHALRWLDMKQDFGHDITRIYVAEEHLIPAGFVEGAGLYLQAPDGRYTGVLSMNWQCATDATDEARRVLQTFSPLLAQVCDRLSSVQRRIDAIDPEAHVVMVNDRGRVCEVDGYATGPHLDVGGVLRARIERGTGRREPRQYLWVCEERECHRVDVVPCQDDARLITVSTIDWPFGLSVRELEVLTLVTMGFTNPQIADGLLLSARTVATHVEHLLTKLDCRTRAELAACAMRAHLRLLDLVDEPL